MSAKPLAALTSGLLARKGSAKPAMRPQGFGSFGARQEDLGWNDMGYEAAQPVPVPDPAPPVVVLQQQELAERVKRPATPKIARTVNGKSAFTLRLDADRHLRLRLASAVRHQSSQQMVTEAVDALLAQVPGLDALAEQAKKHGKK